MQPTLSTMGNTAGGLGIMGNVVKNCALKCTRSIWQHLYSSQQTWLCVPILVALHLSQIPPRQTSTEHAAPTSGQMERRKRGRVRHRERERGEEEEGAVCVSCISASITAKPAFVTGKTTTKSFTQQREKKKNIISSKQLLLHHQTCIHSVGQGASTFLGHLKAPPTQKELSQAWPEWGWQPSVALHRHG